MATPLKLWQYSEPKRLWPTLGGLSVLVHIGLLGLSLPYVLELMQASGTTSAETIPIELIVVSPEEEPVEPIDTPLQNTSASTKEPAKEQPAKEQYSPPPTPDQTPLVNSSTFPQNAIDESVAVPVQPLPEELEQPNELEKPQRGLQDSEPDNSKDNADDSNSAQSSSTDSNGSNGLNDSTREEDTNDGSVRESQTDREPEAARSGNVDEAPVVPTLPGEPTLPVPEEPANNQPAPRPAALSILSFSQVGEMQRDIGKTPPRPKDNAIAAAIELNPVAQGCGQLEFSQPQWTYRVAVRADGSILRATLWTGGVSQDFSEEEETIACLIENAGFQFEPALFEGQPILDDNLLITISVIEIPRSDL